MSAQSQPSVSTAGLTPEQYLEAERAAAFRSEYYNGRVYAMSGGSYAHAQIITGLTAELRQTLRKRPCSVVSSELRLRVSPGGLYTYPDVVAVCGEPRFADDQKDTLLNPTLIAEVLSPSTEAYDRGFKSAQYRTIPSLQEYVLVSQSEPRIEVFHRQKDGYWLLSEAIGLEAACRFESLDCGVLLADVYDKVTFSAAEAAPAERPAS
jgi:Uma2 family endonuclease